MSKVYLVLSGVLLAGSSFIGGVYYPMKTTTSSYQYTMDTNSRYKKNPVAEREFPFNVEYKVLPPEYVSKFTPEHLQWLGNVQTIQTKRLNLRAIRVADFDNIVDMFSDKETIYMLGFMPWPFTKPMIENYLANLSWNIKNGRSLYWAITEKDNDKFIGEIGLTLELEHSKATMHYSLNRSNWGHGYMTECVKTIIDYCFRELNLVRLEINHMTINDRSQKVINKCGFTLEAIQDAYVKKDNGYKEVRLYRILRDEYFKNCKQVSNN